MPDGTPFDGTHVPYCRGPCDAFDDPRYREIVMQWGTRLGKTTISLQILAKVAATKPMPGLFATATQSIAKRIVRSKIYPVLNAIRETRKLLPNERWWTTEEIRLNNSPWQVAWSGSDTQLADLSAFYGYANEIDKWSMNKKLGGDAGEGDPLAQFMERFKEFPDAKIIFECSPSTKSHSRIERKLLASTNCRYFVPCPRCGGYQVLRLETQSPEEIGGLLFDHRPGHELDANLARETARYVCEHCRYEIYDDQRHGMMQAGVWAPRGCGVTKSGKITGEQPQSTKTWGCQLSSLYSLDHRCGAIAEKFVQTFRVPVEYQMFVNGWLAETWEPFKSLSDPEEVGLRLATNTPRGIIPLWATWLFAGVDMQDDHFVYVVIAVGPAERVHVVTHGTCESLDEIENGVIRQTFAHEDGGDPLSPAMTLIDCGFRTPEIYGFCQRFKGTRYKVQPCKGANNDCAGKAYQAIEIGVDEGKSARTKRAYIMLGRGLKRIRVSPYHYEPIIHQQLEVRERDAPGGLSLHTDAARDIDFLRQLCNGAESDEPHKNDPNYHLWVKRWPNEANDIRDSIKYARCAADVKYGGFIAGWKRAEQRQPAIGATTPRPPAAEPQGLRRRERFRPQLRRSAR